MSLNTALFQVDEPGNPGSLPGSRPEILETPAEEITNPNLMIFYGVTNLDAIKGIQLAESFFHEVAGEIRQGETHQTENPVRQISGIENFSTLSPVPGFNDWLGAQQDTVLLKREAKIIREIGERRQCQEQGCAVGMLVEMIGKDHSFMTEPVAPTQDAHDEKDRNALVSILQNLALEYLHTNTGSVSTMHWAKGAELQRIHVTDGVVLANHVYGSMDDPAALLDKVQAYKEGKRAALSQELEDRSITRSLQLLEEQGHLSQMDAKMPELSIKL